ncbi:YDG domain-containing protein, partial [Pedobacter steynii]
TAGYDTNTKGTGKTITAGTFVLDGADKDNYSLSTTTATTTGDITALPITLALNATPVISKVYDGNTTATLVPANYTLTGLIGTDAVTVSGTAGYDTNTKGTGKTITAGTFVLDGADKDNYSLSTTTATTTGDITALPITLALNATPLISKVYDGNTTATLVPANYTLTGLIGTDAVTVSGTAGYDTNTKGTGKTITAGTFVLDGADKDNYSLSTTTATTTGDITALPITLALNATPVISKVYDGNTTATLVPANYTLTGLIGTDAVTVSGTAGYDTNTKGTGKTITAGTFVLDGADKDNYSLSTTTATTTGDITALPITLALNATPLISKVYDGNTTATLVPANYTLTGLIGTDAVTVSGTAGYDTNTKGTGKTITAGTFVLDGADKDNYSLSTTTATTIGDITALPITLALNATPVISKVYDGNTTATLVPANYTLTGLIGTDAVTVSGTAGYDTNTKGTGKTITAGTFVLDGADKDNYSLSTTTATTTGDITALPITLALNATPVISKVYDGNTTATLVPANYTLTGLIGTDAVTVSGTAGYDTNTKGTGKTITAGTFVLDGADKDNYSLSTTTATTTGDITALPITLALNATPVISKVYDGNTTATLVPANYTLTGLIGTDAVTVSGTAGYDTNTKGTGKTITAGTFVLDGADKDNYSLSTTTATTTGDITALPITLALNATPVISKVYDGNTTATLVPANYTLTGLIGTDAVTVSGTAGYDTNTKGTGKTITAGTFVLDGADKDNYSLSTTTATTTGDITALPITLALNATPVISKVYDGNTTATLVPANYTLTGLIGTDAVTVSGTAGYDTNTKGTGKTITAGTFVLDGADKDNYSLSTTTATTTGDITALPITLALNATPVISKVYDGNTTATLVPANYTLTGLIGTDAVTVSGTAGYDTNTKGTGKTITAGTFVLDGADKDNYSLSTTTATTTGDITALPITLALNATPVISKVYDGNTTATLVPANYTLTGLIGTDAVTVSGTAGYDTNTKGTGKTITAGTFVLDGADKDNYSLSTTTATTTGDITALPITLALNATPVISKVYDGNTTATLVPANYSLTGVLGTDAVTVSGTAGYDTNTKGTGKTITAGTFVLDGADKDNYSLSTTTATTTGDITALPITLALNATPLISKVYDGNTTATLVPANYTLTGLIGTDAVTVSGTAGYDTNTKGTGKTITAGTFVLDGADKDNYSLSTTTATTTGDITALPITLALNATPVISKVYDGNTTATLVPANYSLTGVLGTDAVTVSGTAGYDTNTKGTGKTITAGTFVLDGADKDNYSLSTTTATTTGDITALPITLALNATPVISKVYDGNTTATLVPANYSLTGVLGTDAVTVSGTAGYDTNTKGTGKTITAGTFVLDGADKDNYSLSTTTATTTGDITALPITLALNATPVISKVYDGNTTATLVPANYTLTGLIGTDAVTVSGTAGYDTNTKGTGKTITAGTFVLDGADKDNYSLSTTTATTTGDITALPITLALNATPLISKVYDGNTTATLVPANYTLTGLIGTDAVTVSGTAGYDTNTKGTGKTITAGTFVLDGADKDNYSLSTTTASTTGNITPRELMATAEDKIKFQGTINPPLTVTYSGFINGEGINNLTTPATATTTANTVSASGNYDIIVSGGIATNYNFNYVKGTLKVVPGKPTDILLTAVPLFENRPVGTTAGTLSSTSENPSAVYTYSLVNGQGDTNNDAFSIIGNQLKSSATFDFETKANYTIRVRSTTQFGQWLEKQINISISDVNEIPTLSAIEDQSVCYTTSVQNIPLTGISAGPETAQKTTLTTTSSNPDLFQTIAATGTGANGNISYRIKNGAIGTATITITVKDNGGTTNGGVDTYSRTFVLTVNPLPVVTISADKGNVIGNRTEVSKGETILLTATGGSSYSWAADGSILSGQHTATLTVRPRETTTYTVTITNANGCTQSGAFTVKVLDDMLKIKANNILTPNRDGYNDLWVVDNIDFYPNNEVKIFDKSGRLLYSKKGYDNSWEGTYNGEALADGTYYYIIDFGTNKRTFKGFITIIKGK